MADPDHGALVEKPKFRVGHVVRTTAGEQTIYDVEPSLAHDQIAFVRPDGQAIYFARQHIVSVERFLTPIKEQKRGLGLVGKAD